MKLTNTFLPKLQHLGAQQSPTLQKLVELKRLGDSAENVMNLDYLRGAFAVLGEYYIVGIDQGQIVFGSDGEERQFMWMLQMLVDFATGGKMEDLIAIDPDVKAKISELMASARRH